MFPPVEFDDCAGNEDVQFEVSDPSFFVDGDLNLVPRQDVLRSQPVLSIHGLSAHADDTAQVEVTGLPAQSPHTLRVSRNVLCMCLCVLCVCVSFCVFFFVFNQFFHLHFIKMGKGTHH